MAFKVVTIADRISQYPDRRRITKEDGSSELVTVAAEEGSVSAEGTEWGAAYANDLETRIDAETHLLEGNFGKIETTSTAANAYAVGECLVYNGQLYKVTTPISVGNTLTVGTNIAVHSVSAINSKLTKKLLWENNAYPDQFNSQTIPLDFSLYSAFEIEYGASYTSVGSKSKGVVRINGYSSSEMIWISSVMDYREVSLSSTGIYFGAGMRNGSQSDLVIIPYRLYGFI